MDVQTLIQAGLKATYDDLFLFTGSDLDVEHPEYLLTVNIAKQIFKEPIFLQGWSLNLECPTPTAIRFALPFVWPKYDFKKNGRFGRTKKIKRFTKGVKDIRKGRLDIAIFKEGNAFTKELIYAIEVKRANQSKSKIAQDLKRLASLLLLENESGISTLDSGYFVGLRYFKGHCLDEQYVSGLQMVKNEYDQLLSSAVSDVPVVGESEVFTLSKVLETEFDGHDECFVGAHHVVGIIVKMQRDPLPSVS